MTVKFYRKDRYANIFHRMYQIAFCCVSADTISELEDNLAILGWRRRGPWKKFPGGYEVSIRRKETRKAKRPAENVTVRSIVYDYLKSNGFDGLCNDECGCKIGELFVCDSPADGCGPGYKIPCDPRYGCDPGCGGHIGQKPVKE